MSDKDMKKLYAVSWEDVAPLSKKLEFFENKEDAEKFCNEGYISDYSSRCLRELLVHPSTGSGKGKKRAKKKLFDRLKDDNETWEGDDKCYKGFTKLWKKIFGHGYDSPHCHTYYPYLVYRECYQSYTGLELIHKRTVRKLEDKIHELEQKLEKSKPYDWRDDSSGGYEPGD